MFAEVLLAHLLLIGGIVGGIAYLIGKYLGRKENDDERHGYLICRGTMRCNKCGKLFEDIIVVPLPKYKEQMKVKKNER